MILQECPKPVVPKEAPLQMLVSNLDYDRFVGRISIGRVRSGSIKVGQKIGFQHGEDGELRTGAISKLWEFDNNGKREVEEIRGGDICGFSGMDDVVIGDTVEDPTVAVEFGINRSPFVGKCTKSKFLTGPQIK